MSPSPLARPPNVCIHISYRGYIVYRVSISIPLEVYGYTGILYKYSLKYGYLYKYIPIVLHMYNTSTGTDVYHRWDWVTM
jgi:hypothetical protein